MHAPLPNSLKDDLEEGQSRQRVASNVAKLSLKVAQGYRIASEVPCPNACTGSVPMLQDPKDGVFSCLLCDEFFRADITGTLKACMVPPAIAAQRQAEKGGSSSRSSSVSGKAAREESTDKRMILPPPPAAAHGHSSSSLSSFGGSPGSAAAASSLHPTTTRVRDSQLSWAGLLGDEADGATTQIPTRSKAGFDSAKHGESGLLPPNIDIMYGEASRHAVARGKELAAGFAVPVEARRPSAGQAQSAAGRYSGQTVEGRLLSGRSPASYSPPDPVGSGGDGGGAVHFSAVDERNEKLKGYGPAWSGLLREDKSDVDNRLMLSGQQLAVGADSSSLAIAEKLLMGWRLSQQHCPQQECHHHSVPLVIDSENQMYCVQCGFWMVHPDDFDDRQHIQVQQKWKPLGGQLVNDFTPLPSSTPNLQSLSTEGVARGSGADLAVEQRRSAMGFNSSGRHGVDDILSAEAKEMARLHQSSTALHDPAVMSMMGSALSSPTSGQSSRPDRQLGSSPAVLSAMAGALANLQQKLDNATQQLQQPCSMQEQTALMGFIKETALALKALRELDVETN